MTHSHDTSTPAMSAETVPSEEFVLVPKGQWTDAYKAFVGAFDTAIDRRKRPDEYALDARIRLREFNDAVRVTAPAPNPSPAAKGGDAVREVNEEAEREAFGKWWPTHWPNAGSVSDIVWQGWLGRAALSTPTEGPASQTEGMGGDAEARRKRASELMAPLMELSEDELILLRHSLPVETLARLRAALTPPETAEAVPVASDPAPATDDRVEAVAAAMWKEEAREATPRVIWEARTLDAFRETADDNRHRWKRFARAALATEASR